MPRPTAKATNGSKKQVKPADRKAASVNNMLRGRTRRGTRGTRPWAGRPRIAHGRGPDGLCRGGPLGPRSGRLHARAGCERSYEYRRKHSFTMPSWKLDGSGGGCAHVHTRIGPDVHRRAVGAGVERDAAVALRHQRRRRLRVHPAPRLAALRGKSVPHRLGHVVDHPVRNDIAGILRRMQPR